MTVTEKNKKRLKAKGSGFTTVKDTQFTGCSFPIRMQMIGNKLTDAERKVGKYFLGNPAAAYLSITDVVSDSNFGYGTVIRFCRRLGCAGFQEFKVLLAQELNNSSRDDSVDNGDEIAKYAGKIGNELSHTQELLDRETVRLVAEALMNADRTLVTGMAGSTAPAMSFDYRLSRIGIHSQAIFDGYNLAIHAACLRPKDVFMAVSFSGATKDILVAAQVAKDNGATVVSLTNFIHAPMVELADLSLFSATDRDPMSCEVFSNISFNFVLDVVFTQLYKMRSGAADMVEKTFRAISDRRV